MLKEIDEYLEGETEGDLNLIQRALGHKEPSMILSYIDISSTQLSKAAELAVKRSVIIVRIDDAILRISSKFYK